ncbi:MAG: hypothetical protein IRY99_24635 [Isosphaeraceae bacterium]|nr:hypothetical protein [Isosphaeraceae bacterium]
MWCAPLYLAATCTATAGISFRPGAGRAAWNAAALFGWSYLAILMAGRLDFGEKMSVLLTAGLISAGLTAYAAGRLVPQSSPLERPEAEAIE